MRTDAFVGRRSVLRSIGGTALTGLSATALNMAMPALARAKVPGVDDKTIRIGLTVGLTGPITFASRQFSGYMGKYLAGVNASGGINGRALQIITYDDGGKGDVALQNAQRLLLQDDVLGLTTVGSPTTAGILDFLTRQNVPLLFPGSLQHRAHQSGSAEYLRALPALGRANPSVGTLGFRGKGGRERGCHPGKPAQLRACRGRGDEDDHGAWRVHPGHPSTPR